MDRISAQKGVRMNVKDKVVELYSRGYTCRDIEAMSGMPSRQTVSLWAREAGVARPKSHRKRRALELEREDLPEVVGDGPVYPDIDPEDKDAIIYRLQLENDILRGVQEVLKGRALSSSTNREKSELIEWLRANTARPLSELTGSLRISKSSYEYWRHKFENPEPTLRESIADDVERIFREDGDSARGYRFVHAKLAAERGTVTEKAVRDVMREKGLRPVYMRKRRKYSSYAGEIDEAPANIPLNEDGTHDFRAGAPNEKWVTDITEFKLPGDRRKVYLSPIVDLYDTKPVAWSIGTSPDAELANSSLERACATLSGGKRPFCHSDRGCHYRWPGWKRICEENGIVRSMSRKGRSPDNAAAEGFFGRLKNEFFHGRDWSGVGAEEFMVRLDAWLRFYSEERLRLFAEADGRKVYDTIDNHRKRLGLAA